MNMFLRLKTVEVENVETQSSMPVPTVPSYVKFLIVTNGV